MTLLFALSARWRTPAVAVAVVGAATILVSAACDGSSAHRSAHRGAAAVTSSPSVSPTPTALRAPVVAAGSPIASLSMSAAPVVSDRPGDSAASRSLVTHRPVPAQPPGAPPSADGVPDAAVSGEPTASVAPARQAADFTLFTNTDGTLVRWNPCAPIHYEVNVAEAGDPAGALRDVRTAVDDVASATGLTFVYDGETASVPTKAWLDGGTSAGGTQAALVIAWARPGTGSGDSDLFGTDADGEGGWWESGTSNDGVHWVWQIKRGFVVVDPRAAADYAPGFGNGESRGVLLMHELGHAVGLGHTDNQRDVMFPVITGASRPVWGPGDLVGLARVGSGAGCIA